MSLKDNFNQAVKEILKKDGLVGDDLSKDAKRKSELDKYIDPPRKAEQPYSAADTARQPETAEAAEAAETPFPRREQRAMGMQQEQPRSPEPPLREQQPTQPQPQPQQSYNENPYVKTAQSAADFGARPSQPFAPDPFGMGSGGQAAASRTADFNDKNNFGSQQGLGGGNQNYGRGNPPTPPRIPNEPPPRWGGGNDTPYYETEETTIISRNTIIDGNIRSFANINIDGSVKGDVRITKDINVTGKVVGDIECNNSIMNGASMQGNIASKGQVQLDRDSILLGDISAQYLDMNGKIKGNIDVGGKAEFKTDAVVLGNITASTLTVLDGATIQGYVNTTFLQESTANIFPETITVTE